MIKVENLTKTFGPKRAVDGISFSIDRGQVLGFLGPNGAGKSTTMRMIAGFIPPTDGKITFGGHDIVANPIPAKRLMGHQMPVCTVDPLLKHRSDLLEEAGKEAGVK